ncbi:MAG: phosphoglycerate kinase [Deltaproteobacteria bacterium]|nr:phosphoglycerate kinase [Deltaproteobacteria bacterium]
MGVFHKACRNGGYDDAIMENIVYIDEIDIKNKALLIRADFNVPLDQNGNIADDTRIRAVLPTINYCLDENAKVVLMSHMGRPKGSKVPELSLIVVAKRLSRLLDKDVKFVNDCVGELAENTVKSASYGDIILLENLRFHAEETDNDEEFGKKLASLCDIYVNDAFATAHRSHASNVSVTKFAKTCAAGFLIRKELNYFTRAVESPMKPFVAIVGGAKVSGKIEVLSNFADKVDKLIIGGAMSNTFLKAMGYDIGSSLVEDGMIEYAKKTLEKVKEKNIKLYLPVDVVVADRFTPDAETKVTTVQEIPKGWMALDIGPATVTLFTEAIQNAKTIVWNGPMGVFEFDAFSRGTFALVSSVANAYALTIVGGGDTDVALHRAGEFAKMSYVSTGGGAFLELLEGKKLPGIEALIDCSKKNNLKKSF